MDQPKLRSIEACPVYVGGRNLLYLRDATDVAGKSMLIPRESLFMLAQFDGKYSILDLQETYTRRYGQITPALFERMAREDQTLLAATTLMDTEGRLRSSAEPRDRGRTGGFPPTYKLRCTMPATACTVLNYAQAVEPAAQSMVSYASVVFH